MKAQIGSIISGTMRKEDLIPEFVSALRSLGCKSLELKAIESRLADNDALQDSDYSETADYYNSEESDWDLESLFDMLQAYAPDYIYFGAHPGDGSDYGFWVSDILEDDFDGLKVSDTSEIPPKYRGHVLHVNDHGNCTLYVKSARKLKELWSCV